jgi:3-isopropylmalate dehydrogenase
MAQAAHGSAPDIAGRNVANPIAVIRSGAMLLGWLGARYADPALGQAAALVEAALAATVQSGTRTPDLGGTAGTSDFAAAVATTITAGR